MLYNVTLPEAFITVYCKKKKTLIIVLRVVDSTDEQNGDEQNFTDLKANYGALTYLVAVDVFRVLLSIFHPLVSPFNSK